MDGKINYDEFLIMINPVKMPESSLHHQMTNSPAILSTTITLTSEPPSSESQGQPVVVATLVTTAE